MPRTDASNLEGAACADLAPVAVDKYLIEPADHFARRTGKAICSRCVVAEECRDAALNADTVKGGVVGGVSMDEINKARAWRRYELGIRQTVPTHERPVWLRMTEATLMVEAVRLEEDHNEAGDAA